MLVGARFVTFSVRLTLVAKANVIGEKLQQDAIVAIERFFDPLTGGFDGQGWPFGRSIYVSEVYQLLDKLAGVDYIVKTRNSITGDESGTNSSQMRRNPGVCAGTGREISRLSPSNPRNSLSSGSIAPISSLKCVEVAHGLCKGKLKGAPRRFLMNTPLNQSGKHLIDYLPAIYWETSSTDG